MSSDVRLTQFWISSYRSRDGSPLFGPPPAVHDDDGDEDDGDGDGDGEKEDDDDVYDDDGQHDDQGGRRGGREGTWSPGK